MLGELRKHSRSVIIYVLFGIIIVVFVFTFNQAGLDSGCGGKGGRAATATSSLVKVGDDDLDATSLYMGLALTADPPPLGSMGDPKAFQAELIYRSTRFARLRGDSKMGPYIPDPRQVSGLKVRKVMDDLIETWLLSDEAISRGLRAAPEEVRGRITADFTDSSGTFKKKNYEEWVRYGLRTSLGRFEDFVRREILREKMISLVVENVSVSDREARHVASLRKAKRSYEFVEVSPTLLADAVGNAPAAAAQLGIAPTADEVQAWLKAHADDAKRYYDDHKAEFAVEPSFDFSYIKVSAPSKARLASIKDAEQRKSLDAARAEAQAKATDVATTLSSAAPAGLAAAFEAAAKAASDDTASAARGGRVEAPMVARAVAAMDPALAVALATLEPGKATGLVEGDDAYWFAMLRGRTAGAQKTYDESRDAIARRLVALQKAPAVAQKVAEQALQKALANPTAPLVDIARELNAPFGDVAPVKLGETGDMPGMPLTISGLIDWNPSAFPGLGESEDLSKALDALTLDKPVAANLLKVPGQDALYVVRLTSAIAAGEPTVDEVEAARNDYLPLKRQAYYREWLQSVRTAAAAKGTLIEHETLTSMIRDEARTMDEARTRAKKDPKAPHPAMPEPEGE